MTATWNPSDKDSDISLSNGNLSISCSTGTEAGVRATVSRSTGLWYWEIKVDPGATQPTIGMATSGWSLSTNPLGTTTASYAYKPDGSTIFNNSSTGHSGFDFTNGDYLNVAVNFTSGKLWFGKNGTWMGSGDPAADTNATYSSVSGTFFPAIGASSPTNTNGTANFGATGFHNTLPSGFAGVGGPAGSGWDAASAGSTVTLSNAGLTASNSAGTWRGARGLLGHSTGKYYFELVPSAAADAVGVDDGTTNNESNGSNAGYWWQGDAGLYRNGITSLDGTHFSAGNTIGISIDFDAGKIWLAKNNVQLSGDPAAGTSPRDTFTANRTFYPFWSAVAGGTNVIMHDTTMTYTPPTGFNVWTVSSGTNGTMAVTETQDTSTATGNVANVATFALTETQDTIAFVMKGIVAGTLSVTETQDVPAFLGTDSDVIAGPLIATDTQDVFLAPGHADGVTSGDLIATEAQDDVVLNVSTTAPVPILVTVGAAGTALKSTNNGANWTAFNASTSTQLNGVVQCGSGGAWVAVATTGKIFRTTDLTTWSSITSPVTSDLNYVAYGNNTAVAVGTLGRVIRSTDAGLTWSLAATLTGSLNRVTYSALFGFIAVGTVGKVYTSSDGASWTLRSTSIPTATFYGVKTSATTAVITTSNKFLFSTDGANWTGSTAPDTVLKYNVAHDGTTWVTTGAPGPPPFTDKHSTSTNLTVWTAHTLPKTNVVFNDITWDGTNFVQVGARDIPSTGQSAILYSSDGSTWTSVSPGTTTQLRAIYNGSIPGSGEFAHGDLVATEGQDTAVLSGYFQTTNVATFDVTENPDVFVASNGSFMWFQTDEDPDTAEFNLSQAIHGDLAVTEAQDDFVMQEGSGGGGSTLTIKITQATVNDIVTFGASLFDGGTLTIYTGSQPVDIEDDPSGTLVGSITLPDPAFVEAVDGSATKDGTWEGVAVNSGVCGWFRLVSATEEDRIDGTVSAASGSGDMLMSNISVNIGDPLVVTTVNFQMVFNS